MTVAIIPSICAGISAVCGAIIYIVKITKPIVKWYKKVNAANVSVETINTELEAIKKSIAVLDRANRLQFKFLVELTDHMLTGNHEEQLMATRNEILKELTELS